jgi:adenosylhomocysteine nucleosidase
LGTALAGGGTGAGAARAAEALVAGGATALVSFGLAGGLNPALAPGALIVPDAVRTPSMIYRTDAELTRRLGGPVGSLFAGVTLAVTAAEKACLFAAMQCDAVDLESGAVACVAAAHGLPFAAVRVVCDPAGTTLPPAAIIALDLAGRIALPRVLASVLRRPGQVAGLLRLARDAGVARGVLLRKGKEGLLF